MVLNFQLDLMHHTILMHSHTRMIQARPCIVLFVGPDTFIVIKNTKCPKIIPKNISLNRVPNVINGVTRTKSARVTLMIRYVLNVRI